MQSNAWGDTSRLLVNTGTNFSPWKDQKFWMLGQCSFHGNWTSLHVTVAPMTSKSWSEWAIPYARSLFTWTSKLQALSKAVVLNGKQDLIKGFGLFFGSILPDQYWMSKWDRRPGWIGLMDGSLEQWIDWMDWWISVKQDGLMRWTNGKQDLTKMFLVWLLDRVWWIHGMKFQDGSD